MIRHFNTSCGRYIKNCLQGARVEAETVRGHPCNAVGNGCGKRVTGKVVAFWLEHGFSYQDILLCWICGMKGEVKGDSEVFGIGRRMDEVAISETGNSCRRSRLGEGRGSEGRR